MNNNNKFLKIQASSNEFINCTSVSTDISKMVGINDYEFNRFLTKLESSLNILFNNSDYDGNKSLLYKDLIYKKEEK